MKKKRGFNVSFSLFFKKITTLKFELVFDLRMIDKTPSLPPSPDLIFFPEIRTCKGGIGVWVIYTSWSANLRGACIFVCFQYRWIGRKMLIVNSLFYVDPFLPMIERKQSSKSFWIWFFYVINSFSLSSFAYQGGLVFV